MPIAFELPGALQPYAGGQAVIMVDDRCSTVGDALDALGARCPGVIDRVIDEQGAVRPHVNVFVDDQSIRFLRGLDTPISDDSTIVIVPAVSGG